MKPRSSMAGKYMACPARLWYDMNHPKPKEHFRNRYMSFGTIVHYDIQARMGCEGMEEPAEEDWVEAEPMLDKRGVTVDMAVKRLADAGFAVGAFKAEEEWENEYLTGHTDLRCDDVIIDIKTTTKPPARGQVAVEHYWQLLAYHLLTGCKHAAILYVSSKGEWVTLSDSIVIADVCEDLDLLESTLRNPDKRRVYGSACTGCPHVQECRDRNIPFYPEPTKPVEFQGGGALKALGL